MNKVFNQSGLDQHAMPISSGRSSEQQVVADVLALLPSADDRRSWEKLLPAKCYSSPEFFEFERKSVFTRSWMCVGHVQQIAEAGDCLSTSVAGEQILVTRRKDGSVGAMSAVCQHRGHAVTCTSTSRLRCALHAWTYDYDGKLIGAPHMGSPEVIRELRSKIRLPAIRTEVWHGFIFVNMDQNAAPLGPSLAKVESFWDGYEEANLVCLPPKLAGKALPWNWKVQVENFTDAYHTEFVHSGTHDFAPSSHSDTNIGGVVFTPMALGDNAIVRTVPMVRPDGGMMEGGWGEDAAFPPIPSLSIEQRKRVTFVLIPPSMTLVFTPNNVAYTLLSPAAVEATFASSDRVTAGGWLLPKSTTELPDFKERTARVQAGASMIWSQDVPVNTSMQRGKSSRYLPEGRYGPLETTLSQFNGWLLNAYAAAQGDL